LKMIADCLDGQRALLSLVTSDLRRKPYCAVLCSNGSASSVIIIRRWHFTLRIRRRFAPRPAAAGVLAKKIAAAANHQRDSPGDLGGDQPRTGRQCQKDKLELGAMVRIDGTVTAADARAARDALTPWLPPPRPIYALAGGRVGE
jgi:hypothetical protein